MILKGNPVSPGVALGEAFLYQVPVYEVLESYVEKGSERKYMDSLELALYKANSELEDLMAALMESEPDKAKIFAAHREILGDEEILEMLKEAVEEEGKHPDFAVKSVFDKFIELIGNVKDPLIAARTADLKDVCNRLLRILKGEKEKNLSSLPENSIVVAKDLLPSDTATIDRAHVAGIITEAGGAASHTAIIARGYRIPAVAGVDKVLEIIEDGTTLVLDALTGEITVSPDEKKKKAAVLKAEDFKNQKAEAEKFESKPAVTADGIKVEIGINIGTDKFCVPFENYDFVGLFRTEFLYMESNHLPTEEEQLESYKRVLEQAKGKPVTLRTLDIGGDKTLSYMQLPKEGNPFLGNRALRLCFKHTDLFETQLRAALRASAFGPLQIMFPMVGSIEDIRRAKAAVLAVKEQLRREKQSFNENTGVGVMIEIPAAAVIADLVAEEVDFASVGTNDLAQYLCAADRMNPETAVYYQSMSPAMLRVLGTIFEAFHRKGKPVSVCGELAGDPEAAVLLAGLGLRKFSMSESGIAQIKAVLAGINTEKARETALICKQLCTEKEVKEYLAENTPC